MPVERFEDHIEVKHLDDRVHLIAKTWQGRDFIRVMEGWDNPPGESVTKGPGGDSLYRRYWKTHGYLSAKQPQQTRIHT